MKLKNTNQILLGATFIYLVAVTFKLNNWPGATELSVLSAPMVSFLLFRHHRIFFKQEKNILLRHFMMYSSAFISFFIFLSLAGFTSFINISYDLILAFSWTSLTFQTVVYYVYYLISTKNKVKRIGYFTIFLIGLIYFIQTMFVMHIGDFSLFSTEFWGALIFTLVSFALLIPARRQFAYLQYQPSLILLIAGLFMLSVLFISKSAFSHFM
jgi:hypothetical protein